MWPEWLTEARIAILIACASALFSWRLARNDTLKMRRKKPSLELQLRKSEYTPEGWAIADLVVRNLDVYSVDVKSVSTRQTTQKLCHSIDAWENGGLSLFLDEAPRKIKSVIPSGTVLTFDHRVEPYSTAGATDSSQGIARLEFYAFGITNLSDLRLHWAWADGHKDPSLLSKLRALIMLN